MRGSSNGREMLRGGSGDNCLMSIILKNLMITLYLNVVQEYFSNDFSLVHFLWPVIIYDLEVHNAGDIDIWTSRSSFTLFLSHAIGPSFFPLNSLFLQKMLRVDVFKYVLCTVVSMTLQWRDFCIFRFFEKNSEMIFLNFTLFCLLHFLSYYFH